MGGGGRGSHFTCQISKQLKSLESDQKWRLERRAAYGCPQVLLLTHTNSTIITNSSALLIQCKLLLVNYCLCGGFRSGPRQGIVLEAYGQDAGEIRELGRNGVVPDVVVGEVEAEEAT